jgi:mono/diheme cytochrome c family protein
MLRLFSRTRAVLRAGRAERAIALGTAWVAIAATTWLVAGTPRLHAQPAASSDVTPVVGPSWLSIQGLALHETSMCWTGAFGPGLADGDAYTGQPSTGQRLGHPQIQMKMTFGEPGRPFTMTGQDLYRVNCQSCHGDTGDGRPPEVPSLADSIKADPQAMGDHLLNGYRRMPPFRRLNAQELGAIRGYVSELVSGGTGRGATVTEPYTRVGELLVKGTCHICHDATGPGRDPEFLMEGGRPSLTAIAKEDGVNIVVQKVLGGAVIPMGTPPILHRGRMPVFYYLTQDEVAAAYYYISRVQPQARKGTETANDGYAN